MAAYDIDGTVSQLASVVRAAFVPAQLRHVYDAIPRLFSDQAPFAFFEYRGGSNDRDAFGVEGASSTRVWEIDAVVCQCLVGETDTADQMTRAFVGSFYRAIRDHSTLGDTVDEALVIKDTVEPVAVNGGTNQASVFLANVFTVQITEFVE